ncbi:15611_t:CDS:2, partial [Racocetra fulgida]
AAYVGPQMLSAAVSGNIFASPSVTAILAGIRRIQSPHGTLLIVKNYTGDCLNFGLAAERAKNEGIKVDMIIVGDDVSIGRNSAVGRRGLAGTVLVHKVAGAVAASGGTLEETKSIASLVAENVGTIGVAFDQCKIPGFQKIPIPPPRDLVHKMLDTILNTEDPERSFLDIHPEKNSIVLLVNNLGGLSTCELFRCTYDAVSYLDRDIIQMLDQHVEAPGWINRIYLDHSSLDTKLDEQISNSSIKTSDDKYSQTILCGKYSQIFESTLNFVSNAMIQAEPDITQYDKVVGDGDCGTTMKNCAIAVLIVIPNIGRYGFVLLDIIKALEERQIVSHDPVEATAQIGNILEKQGGTIETLENYTPARTGDRTMMDVLIPFIDTFSSSLDSEDNVLKALKLAVNLAKNHVESTKFLKPKFGRSTYISYDDIKNSGVPDPGAFVVYQIVKSIYDNLQLNL